MAFCGQCGTKSNGGAFCAECGAAVVVAAATPTNASVPTSFVNRCDILADLWVEYKNDEEFEDFISYNDLGLPLSYAVANNIADSNEKIEGFINDTFQNLLDVLEIADAEFESLPDMLIHQND